MMSRSRFWLVAGLVALLVFSVPALATQALSASDPEVRLFRTGQGFSALIATRDARVLLVNSADRGLTRSAAGYLARPWEPAATVLVAPSGDREAVGLWEALRHPAVRQVIVLGLPGNDPLWSTIERECRERDIELTFLGAVSTILLGDVAVTLFPRSDHAMEEVDIRRGSAAMTIALGPMPPRGRPTHALVMGSPPEGEVPASLLIVPAGSDRHPDVNIVSAGERDVVRVVLEIDRLRVVGGRLLSSASAPN